MLKAIFADAMFKDLLKEKQLKRANRSLPKVAEYLAMTWSFNVQCVSLMIEIFEGLCNQMVEWLEYLMFYLHG